MDEIFAQDVRNIKRRLAIKVDQECGVQIIAIAIARKEHLNEELSIPAQSGDPICNEVYDIVRDCYYCYGSSWINLGNIPVSCSVVMDEISGWEVDIPIPMSVAKKYMSNTQRETLLKWKRKHRNKDYEIKFMQIRNVY